MPNSVNKYLEEKITKTGEFFRNSPSLLLSEADMQCHLFRLIYEEIDQIGNYNVYSELHWYSDNNKLQIRADISIISSKNLKKISHDGSFKILDEPYNYIIELKLNSSNRILYKNINQGITNDIKKVNNLISNN